MTLNQSALLELSEALRAGDGVDLMRTALQSMLQLLVEAEATATIGAGPRRSWESNRSTSSTLQPTSGPLRSTTARAFSCSGSRPAPRAILRWLWSGEPAPGTGHPAMPEVDPVRDSGACGHRALGTSPWRVPLLERPQPRPPASKTLGC